MKTHEGRQRQVLVAPERVHGWVRRFGERHGAPMVWLEGGAAILEAPDGARAKIIDCWQDTAALADLDDLVQSMLRARQVAVLLARKSAHAVGVFSGTQLTASKVDTHYVQGRTKKGGWSQQRYARRRNNQADKAWQDAAEDLVHVVMPFVEQVDAFCVGGDSASVSAVLRSTSLPRRELKVLQSKRTAHPLVPVPDPRLSVLKDSIELFRAVPIVLNQLA